MSYMRRIFGIVLKATAEAAQVVSDAAKEASSIVQEVATTVEKKPATE